MQVIMLQRIRHLTFRPSSNPGILSPLTVRSTGHYRFADSDECNAPRSFSQLFWMHDGHGEFLVEGKWQAVSTGDAFFYKARVPHGVRAGARGCAYYWATFDGPFAGEWLADAFQGSSAHRAGPCPVDLFEELRRIIRLPSIASEKQAAELGIRLLIRSAERSGESGSPEYSREGELCRLLEAQMEAHFLDPDFGIEAAARILGWHRTTLFRIYRRHRGIAPSAYLQRLRLQNGLELLKGSGKNITEIAQASGYRDSNYFAKVVRRATGEAPGNFREHG